MLKKPMRHLTRKCKAKSSRQLPPEVDAVLRASRFSIGGAMGREPDWNTAKALDQRWEITMQVQRGCSTQK
jgi:hypothetical protein